MPRTFEVRQQFDASAAQVRAMMVDPEYIAMRARRTGAAQVEVTVELASELEPAGSPVDRQPACTLRITRVLPTDQAPGFARSLLGDSITVAETQVWPAVVDGTANATMEAQFGSLLRLTASIALSDAAHGSIALTQATCKAAVPLVGGKVESLVQEQVSEYLAYEERIAQDWLSGQRD